MMMTPVHYHRRYSITLRFSPTTGALSRFNDAGPSPPLPTWPLSAALLGFDRAPGLSPRLGCGSPRTTTKDSEIP